jgi:hypothetical protein
LYYGEGSSGQKSYRLSARDVIFGILFIALGSMMVCGGVLSGPSPTMVFGLLTGISLIVGGFYYFTKRS